MAAVVIEIFSGSCFGCRHWNFSRYDICTYIFRNNFFRMQKLQDSQTMHYLRQCTLEKNSILFVSLSFNHCSCNNALRLYFIMALLYNAALNTELQSRPIFSGSGYDPSKIKRLRLLVNCKADYYEFVTTKKNIFFLIQNYRIT